MHRLAAHFVTAAAPPLILLLHHSFCQNKGRRKRKMRRKKSGHLAGRREIAMFLLAVLWHFCLLIWLWSNVDCVRRDCLGWSCSSIPSPDPALGYTTSSRHLPCSHPATTTHCRTGQKESCWHNKFSFTCLY